MDCKTFIKSIGNFRYRKTVYDRLVLKHRKENNCGLFVETRGDR